VIAKNKFAQVDSEGNQFLLLQEITDHKEDHSAVPVSKGTVHGANGQRKPKVTTRVGWSGKAIHKLGKVEASNPGGCQIRHRKQAR
jgi:hypothetical protein